MEVLYLKKQINDFTDLNWLENEIIARTHSLGENYVKLKLIHGKEHIDSLMNVLSNVSSQWTLKPQSRYTIDQANLMSPTGHTVFILDENNKQMQFYKQ